MILKMFTFGVARDITGAAIAEMETEEGITVADLKQQLFEKYPRFGALSSLLIAVNAEYGDDHTVLRASDEIALIPPVSGG